MDLPAWMTPTTVTVEPAAGSGAYGPTYGDPVTSRAQVEYRRQRVTGTDGAVVVSLAVVRLPLAAFGDLPVGSQVTVPGDQPRTAVAVNRWEHNTATPNHWEVYLR